MDGQMKEEIKSFLVQNRVSTTEVADALGKSGSILGIMPINEGFYSVGSIFHIRCAGGSNYGIHDSLPSIMKGDVLLIEPVHDKNIAYVGDLISKFAILYQGAAAIVVDGNIRDTARIKRENYPIWAQGSNPVGAVNTNREEDNFSRYGDLHGGIAVCDDGGVVVIKPKQLNKKTFESLRQIEIQEDIWYFCLNTLRWTTKEIVCDKSYLRKKDELPRRLLESLEDLDNA